jgi:site-specific recombinase XerC
MKQCHNVATLIERYFTERLMRQRNVSANTIASYRDTFRLLFTMGYNFRLLFLWINISCAWFGATICRNPQPSEIPQAG